LDGKQVARFAEPRHVNIPCHGRKGVASWPLNRLSPVDWRMIVALWPDRYQTRVAGGGVIAAGDASGGNAAIRVGGEDSAGLVYRKVIEVQKVPGAVGARSPLGTDHPELHGIVGRGIHSEPSLAPL